jgi:hypothetical protein
MTFIATAALLLAATTLLVLGGVLLAPFLLGLFFLALVGVLARRTDGRVERRDTKLDASGWRSPCTSCD